MKKFLLQLFSLVICAFAETMMAQAQVAYEPYHFGIFGGLADNPTSETGVRVTEDTRTAIGTTSAPTPTPGCIAPWSATSTTNAPSPRSDHTAVWTGSEMIVWGGGGYSNTGGRYNPATDTWTATSTSNTPRARAFHTAVWTGSEMIVWGGYDGSNLNSGGRYNPGTDTWTATSTTNAPS